MNKLDINTVKEVIFTLNDPVTTNITLQEAVFQNIPIDDAVLNEALSVTSKETLIHDMANENADYAETNGLQLDSIQLSVFPSTLYSILRDCVQFISPINCNEINSIKIFVCKIQLNKPNKYDIKYGMALYYLSTLSIDLERPSIINQSVYDELLIHNKYVKIEIVKEYSFKKLDVVLPLIANKSVILSLTKQSRIKDELRSILSHTPPIQLNSNNASSDLLQLVLINQQLKHYIYLILKPLLPLFFLRVKNYGRHFISKSGELNINLYFDGDKLDKSLIIETINQLMHFGILITNANQLGFGFNKIILPDFEEIEDYAFKGYSKQLLLERKTKKEQLGANDFNYILFRLLGNDYKELIQKIDDLIINGDEQDLLNEILRIV